MANKLGKRVVSGLLAAFMLMSSISSVTVSALAADDTVVQQVAADPPSADTDPGESLISEVNVEEPAGDETPAQPPAEQEIIAEPTDAPVTPSEEPTAEVTPPAEVSPEPTPTETVAPVVVPTEPPADQAVETATPEPSGTPEPEIAEEPTPTPIEEPVDEEEIAAIEALWSQLPETVEEVADYNYQESTALYNLLGTLIFSLGSLPEETLASYDIDLVDALYEAVNARMGTVSPDFDPLTLTVESNATSAQVGDEVRFDAKLNRDDVDVMYQWQSYYIPEVNTETVVDYEDADGEQAPTWYAFVLEDKTEAEYLAESEADEESTAGVWQGMELWLAARDALAVIGESADELTFVWKTTNYPLYGYTITANKELDGSITLTAASEEDTFIARKNEEGKYEFTGVAKAVVDTNDWQDIAGATEASYSRTVTEQDRTTSYRCVVTVVDDLYMAQAKAYGEAIGIATAETASEDTATAETADGLVVSNTLTSSTIKLEMPQALEAAVASFFSLRAISASNARLSNDGQWIEGINGNTEYLTAETYAKVQQWLSEGRISQAQADMYWTKTNAPGSANTANVLDDNGMPTGATRQYGGVQLTDGNKMEVLSAWYGKTVYFRQVGESGSGTPVDIPAYAAVGVAGEQYKSAVTILSAYIPDAGRVYVTTLGGTSGYYENDTHITMYSVTVEKFNADPDRYLMDAEGSYRMDSFAWGPGVYDEPDISGKAFWALKAYIADGYGMLIGHDTMYGYAGSYVEAWADVNGPGTYYGKDPDGMWYDTSDGSFAQNGAAARTVRLSNRTGKVYSYCIIPIDRNDTTTHYYNVNAWNPNWGHWNMNSLMGENNADVFAYDTYNGDQGASGDYEFFRVYDYADPMEVPSRIMSAGGSHFSPYYKTTMYGSSNLRIAMHPYSQNDAINYPKYRVPTNFPYDIGGTGTTFNGAVTHSNMQVAFGDIWIEYADNKDTASVGNGRLLTPTVTIDDVSYTGTNNFYLAGDQNFLMNQIGHLPENSYSRGEGFLLVNTIMYISQRKQCEVCQSAQDEQPASHFVHRVNTTNAKRILTALANGGSFWFPLDDCYMLTDDLNLETLFPDGSWNGIANFCGHWSSDQYTVTLPQNGNPLFLHDDNPEGKYSDSEAAGWNLGNNPKNGVENVRSTDGSKRTTGVARVVGTLTGEGTYFDGNANDYAGYKIVIRGDDAENKGKIPEDAYYVSTVNTDGKYVMSNLPCIYNGSTAGTLLVHVYDTEGNEVTKYGKVRVDVDAAFWDNDMTTTLYIGNFKINSIPDQETYEMQAASYTATLDYDQIIPETDVKWQYRANGSLSWQDVSQGPWGTDYSVVYDGSGTNEFGDPVTKTTLTINHCQTNWTGYFFRAVFASQNRGTVNTNECYTRGRTYYTINEPDVKAAAYANRGTYLCIQSPGNYGRLEVKPWPARTTQGFDVDIYAGQDASYTVTTQYWAGAEDGLTATWEYAVKNEALVGEAAWVPISTNNILFGNGNVSTSISTKDKAIPVYGNIASEYGFTNYTQKETTATLNIASCGVNMDGKRFRVKFSYTTPSGARVSWASNASNELSHAWNIDVRRIQSATTHGTLGDDGKYYCDFGEDQFGTTVKDQSAKLFVKEPLLESELLPSEENLIPESYQEKGMVDEYGQFAMMDAGATYTPKILSWTAIIYYLPNYEVVTPYWEYKENKGLEFATWNQAAVNALPICTDADTGKTLTTTQTDITLNNGLPLGKDHEYYNSKYDGYCAIKSVMTIQDVPLAMYDTPTQTKFNFRCAATGVVETPSYKSVKHTNTLSGGLYLDYEISLLHMGAIAYAPEGKNIINGLTAINAGQVQAATSGREFSIWEYPKLAIVEPKFLNSALVAFGKAYECPEGVAEMTPDARKASSIEKGKIDGRDNIDFSAVETYIKENNLNVRIDKNAGATVHTVVLRAQGNSVNAITTEQWEEMLRLVKFTVYEKAAFYPEEEGGTVGGVEINWMGAEEVWEDEDLLGLLMSDNTAQWTKDITLPFATGILGDGEEAPDTSTMRGQQSANPNGHYYMILDSDYLKDAGYKEGKVTYAEAKAIAASMNIPGVDSNGFLPVIESMKEMYFIKLSMEEMANAGIINGQGQFFLGLEGCDRNNRYEWGWTEGDEILEGRPENERYVWFSTDEERGGKHWNHDGNGVNYNEEMGELCNRYLDDYNHPTSEKELWNRYCTGNGDHISGSVGVTLFKSAHQPDIGNPYVVAGPLLKNEGGERMLFNNNIMDWMNTGSEATVSTVVIEFNGESYDFNNLNHDVEDTDRVGTDVELPASKEIFAQVNGATKIYDGTELEARVTIDSGVPGAQNFVTATYTCATASAGYTTTTITPATLTSGNHVINSGLYEVELSLTEEGKKAGYVLKGIGNNDANLRAELIIEQRPINLFSHNNNRQYNGNSVAEIKNIQIEAFNEENHSGVVAGDSVTLTTYQATGFYRDTALNEMIHAGTYAITRTSDLAIANNPNMNYYLGGEDYTGSIEARPVYLHSTYHDDTSYSYTYTGLTGTKVTKTITRYTRDQYNNYETEVVEPNNIKAYDNTTAATIENISIDNIIAGDSVSLNQSSYAGVYATMNAGETLIDYDDNGDKGTIQKDRYNKLTENDITLADAKSLYLVNNDNGDYYIAGHDYSGAIYRQGLEVQVDGEEMIYGDGMKGTPTIAPEYNATNNPDSWVSVATMMGEDVLRQSEWTKQYKNEFVLELRPVANTPVGEYTIDYIGLNEFNFPVLSNYVVNVYPNALSVRPRQILVDVDESKKTYGDQNPAFYSTFSYGNTKLNAIDDDTYTVIGNDAKDNYADMKLVAGDTVADVLQIVDRATGTGAPISKDETTQKSNIPYLSDCETNSDVLYVDETSAHCDFCSDRDGVDRNHFSLGGYGVWVNENTSTANTMTVKTVQNIHGEDVQNYELVYNDDVIKVHPLAVKIIPHDKTMVYGTANEPALTYDILGRRVQWDDLWNVTLERDPGVDVYDAYTIKVKSFENSSNYIVETETAVFRITPAPLVITPVFTPGWKYYGDETPDWDVNVSGYKYKDTRDTVFVDGAKNVELNNKDFGRTTPVGSYGFNVVETTMVVAQNAFGCQNYVLTFNPASVTVRPRPITIQVEGWMKLFGEEDPEHGLVITDNLTGKTGVNGTDPNVCVDPANAPILYDIIRAAGEEVGTYPIYSSAREIEKNHEAGCHCVIDDQNPNYIISYIPDVDVITKGGLVGIVDNHTRYYGDNVTEYIDGGVDNITYFLDGVEITPEEAGITSKPIYIHGDVKTSSIGSYQIGATNVESSKYEVQVVPGYVTVIPRPVTVIAQDNSKIYGDAEPTLDFIIHDGHSEDGETYYVGKKVTDLVGDDVRVNEGDLAGDVARQAGEDVGMYPIDINNVDPHSVDGKENYDIKFVEAEFEIKPAALLVTVLGGYSKSYGDENPTFGTSITGFKNDDTQETALTGEIGIVTTSTRTSPVGKYIVSAKPSIELEDGNIYRGSTLESLTNSKGMKNYEILYIDGDITIQTLKLQVIIDRLTKVYGKADPTFTYVLRKVDGSVATIIDPDRSPLNMTLTRTEGENVGKGDITTGEYAGSYTITGEASNTNYEVEVIDGSLTITPAVITVTVNGGYKKVYGEPNPVFSDSFSGFVGSEQNPDETGTGILDTESVISGTPVIQSFNPAGKPVDEKTRAGTYRVFTNVEESALSAENYTFKYVDGDIVISKKPIVIIIDDQEKIYGDSDPDTFTWHFEDEEELINYGDEALFDITTQRPTAGTDEGEQVGKYPITGTGTVIGDYDVIIIPGTETIKPATILVTVVPDTKYYGEDNPETKVSITGYKRGDTIDSIGGKEALVINNEATKWSPVTGGSLDDGKYPVSAKDSSFKNENYEFVYIDGTLEILPLGIHIVVDDAQKVYGTHDPNEFTSHFDITDATGRPYEPTEELIAAVERNLALDTIRTPGEAVGTYPIKPVYKDVDNFVIISSKDGVFTITPAPLVITANSAIKVYDGQPLINKGYTSEGLIDDDVLGIHDTLTSVTVNGSQTEVGKSPNVPSDAVLSMQNGANGNRNYKITYVNGVLEVTPKEAVLIEKSADRETATDGTVITYTIRVTNTTLHDLRNVQVVDTNNFANEIGVLENDAYSYANGVFTINYLPSGANSAENFCDITYTYKVKDNDHGTNNNDMLANTAKVTDFVVVDGTEPDESWYPTSEEVKVKIIRHTLETVKSADKEIVNVGDAVTYSIKVTNTGNVTLENIVVRDDNNFTGEIESIRSAGSSYNGDETWTISRLGVGRSVTIRYKYTVLEEDLPLMELDNIATATVPPSDGIPEEDFPSNEVEIPIIARSVAIEKSADKSEAYPGDVVTYTLNVRNNGTVDLSNLTVTDHSNGIGMVLPLSGTGYTYADGVFTIDSLLVGETVNIRYLYTVMNNDPSTITNVATVHVPQGDSETEADKPFDKDSNPVDVVVLRDKLTVVKTAAETSVEAGETIHYTIVVTNTGTTTLKDVVVKDISSGTGKVVNTTDNATYNEADNSWTFAGTMAPNAEYTVTYSYTVTETDALNGKVENTAVATGKNPKGKDVPSEPSKVDVPVTIPEVMTPSVKIEKNVDKDRVMVGDTLTYTLKITNDGNIDQHNIKVTDKFNGKGALNRTDGKGYTYDGNGIYTIAELAVGESVEITYQYVVVSADKDVLSNIAVVEKENPPIEPEKEADKNIAAVNEVVTYTIRVHNNTQETVTDVLVTDRNNFKGNIDAADGEGYVYNGDKTWTIASIEAGATATITYTYTMQDEDESVIVNRAEVKYTEDGTDYVIPTNPVDVEKPEDGEVTIVKSADKKEAVPGEVVTYKVTVFNAKNHDVTNVVVTDANNFAGTITAVDGADYRFEDGQFVIDRIAQGESVTLTYTYTVQDEDVPTHLLDNIATAQVPGTNPEDPENPGHGVDPEKPIDPDTDIPSNEVEVEVPGDNTDTPVDPTPVGELKITKTVDKDSAAIGDTLNYVVKVENVGKATIKNALVEDYFDGHGELKLVSADGLEQNDDGTFTIKELPVGASVEIHFTYVVVEADVPMVLNAAVVTTPKPVEPTKSADKYVAVINDVVTYTIAVKNTDSVAHENVLVSDTNNFMGEITPVDGEGYVYNGDKTWTIANLASGATVNVVYTYTVQTEDPSILHNEADIRYTSDGEEIIVPTNPVDVVIPKIGEVTIAKTADKTEAKPGDDVHYTVTVHNGKGFDVHNVEVTDANNFAGTITGVDGAGYTFENGRFVIDTIPDGGDVVIHYTYTVQVADVDTKVLKNIATAHVPGTNPEDPENPGHGVDPEKPLDPDSDIPSNEVEVKIPGDDTETPVDPIPAGKLEITKAVDKAVATVGETLNYVVTVRNVGEGPIKNALVEDYFEGHGKLTLVSADGFEVNNDGSFTVKELPAGEALEIHYSYVVVAADAPKVLNAAVVTTPTPIEPTKSADKYVAMINDVVTYTIAVKNTDTVAHENVLVSDTNNFTGNIVAVDGEGYVYNGNKTWTIANLDAGATVNVVYTYTVQTEDPSTLHNEADIRYTDDGSEIIIPTNPVDVVIPEIGEVTIVKTADKTVAKPGDVVNYTVTVHNGKGFDVNNVEVTDANNFAGIITAVDGANYIFEDGKFIIDTIPDGGDVVIHYAYTVQIADVDTQILKNVATVHVPGTNPEDPENPGHGIDPEKPLDPDSDIPSNEVDVEVPGDSAETEIPPEKESLNIRKTADKNIVKVGETINYTITVENDGDVTMNDITVNDYFDGVGTLNVESSDKYTYNASAKTFHIDSLAKGASVEIKASYVVEADDGDLVMNAAVIDESGKVPPIEKSADKTIANVGEVITYTVKAHNIFDEAITNAKILDTNNFAGRIESVSVQNEAGDELAATFDYATSEWVIESIEADETAIITYTYTVMAEDTGDVLVNDATMKYTYGGIEKDVTSNKVVVNVPEEGTVTIAKSADKKEAKPGDTVHYTVVVTNSTPYDISNAVVTDANNFAGTISFDGIEFNGYTVENGKIVLGTLSAGATLEIHYNYVVGIDDVDTAVLENIATIHYPNPEDPNGPNVEIPSNEVEVDVPGSEVDVPVIPNRRVSIHKEADKTVVKPGEVINYTITVTNQGNEDLRNVEVLDGFDGHGEINVGENAGVQSLGNRKWVIDSLRIGESVKIHYSYVALAEDADVITNVAIAVVPGTNPEDPENPGHGIDPEKPIDNGERVPSNEVQVEVKLDGGDNHHDNDPTPTPAPNNDKPVTPATPTPPAFVPPAKTGVGLLPSLLAPITMIGVAAAALFKKHDD